MVRTVCLPRVGSVVGRRRRVGLVMDLAGDQLLIAPVTRRAFPRLAGDVPIEAIEDLLTVRANVDDDVVVRLSAAIIVPSPEQRVIGELTQELMHWISQVWSRLSADVSIQARWSAARATYREHLVGERAVKL